MKNLNLTEEEILSIIKNTTFTHEQALMNISSTVLCSMTAVKNNKEFFELKNKGLLCDMGEGYAPYCPRYILPDYEKLLKEGCKFLRLDPPTNLKEAILTLEIFYRHVPSITHFPVYLGRLDKLLEPFVEDYDKAYELIKDFLVFIDRTISDSYCHVNLGPEETVVGNIIIDIETELKKAIPSITLLYDPDVTSDTFAEKCIKCEFSCAKPSFANHQEYKKIFNGDYGIASCYNALEIGGGAFTLSRLILKNIAECSKDKNDMFKNVLPHAINVLCEFIEEKIDFLVNESHFFKSSFLVNEGFLKLEKFTGMFGIVGLNECVNIIMQKEGKNEKYGYSPEADDLAEEILQFIKNNVDSFKSKYCDCTDNHFAMHAQVGIDLDIGISPGARIAIGSEPDLYSHIRHSGRYHKYFRSGVGDIFPFEETAKKNPKAVVDIIKGAFRSGMRYFSTYSSDCDVVRITGYLVKKSDMDKLENGEVVQQGNVLWGLGSRNNNKSLERKVRKL